MPKIIIIDFCITCGVQLREGLGLLSQEEQVCENCGSSVYDRSSRAKGEFSEEDGKMLIKHLEG